MDEHVRPLWYPAEEVFMDREGNIGTAQRTFNLLEESSHREQRMTSQNRLVRTWLRLREIARHKLTGPVLVTAFSLVGLVDYWAITHITHTGTLAANVLAACCFGSILLLGITGICRAVNQGMAFQALFLILLPTLFQVLVVCVVLAP